MASADSTPSTDIETISDKLEKQGVSDDIIQSFLSYLKEKNMGYEAIKNDIKTPSTSNLYKFFAEKLKNDTLFTKLVIAIKTLEIEKGQKAEEQLKKEKINNLKHSSYSILKCSNSYQPRRCSARCSAPIMCLAITPNIGLSLGGSKDINNFRKCIQKNVMPLIDSITYNGIFNEYYFDTNTTKHIDNTFECVDQKENEESMLFYPSYCYAKIMNNNVREYYMTVGLNSNLKQDEFKRKHLNILMLVDISGSMNSSFGNDTIDIDLKGEWRNNLQIDDKIDVKANGNRNSKWYNAKVIQVNNELKKVEINFIGFSDKYNEYISVNSNRIAPFNSVETKLNCTKNGIKSIIKQLTVKDRISVVTFANKAKILQKLEFINDINMEELSNKIGNMSAKGSTNFEIGFQQSIEVYKELFNDNEYELLYFAAAANESERNMKNRINSINSEYDNRMIIFTDAQLNEGIQNTTQITNLIKKYAENKCENIEINNRIYNTFIGVGLDFNSSLIDNISNIRGCNYYSVKNTKEFNQKMNQEFEFMVTPLVFNVCLRLKSEGNSCTIEHVYGMENNIMKNGEITKINTLFPSKKSQHSGETKGGIQLIKLKKNNDVNDEKIMVEIEVTFENRNGKKYTNIQNVIFSSPKEKIIVNNDMIEMDEKEKESNERNVNFYDNNGIRKAILLCKYVQLIKKWIKNNSNKSSYYSMTALKVNDEYKKMFTDFMKYFEKEMIECNDNTLKQEIDIMDKLVNLSDNQTDDNPVNDSDT